MGAREVFIFGFGIALMACAPLTPGARIISEFGATVGAEGYPRQDGPHGGVDVWGHLGAPVLASANGEVVKVGEEPSPGPGPWADSCGKYVVLEHEDPDQLVWPRTSYCHLGKVAVKRGDRVKRGDVIGSIGTTGQKNPAPASFIHVHWELMRGRRADPLKFSVGCFDPKATYPTDRFVLTLPVRC